MSKDARSEHRETMALPMTLRDGGYGVTRDISASGLFFLTDAEQALGGTVDFEIDLELPGGPVKLVAQGQIVRIERRGRKTGVGVKLLQSRLEHRDK
jgi:hypothetical protein